MVSESPNGPRNGIRELCDIAHRQEVGRAERVARPFFCCAFGGYILVVQRVIFIDWAIPRYRNRVYDIVHPAPGVGQRRIPPEILCFLLLIRKQFLTQETAAGEKGICRLCDIAHMYDITQPLKVDADERSDPSRPSFVF